MIKLKIAILFLLIPSLCLAGNFGYYAGASKQGGAGGCGGYAQHLIYNDSTGSTGNTALTTDASGQSFQVASNITLHSIEIYMAYAAASTDFTVRVGTAKDMSSYLAECTVTSATTTSFNLCDMSATAPSLSTGTTYYIGVMEDAGDARWNYASTGRVDYANGHFINTSSGWTIGTDWTGGDYWFIINSCTP